MYKQGFRYEVFTLIIQGNAALESGTEHLISIVGPFNNFGASALLGKRKKKNFKKYQNTMKIFSKKKFTFYILKRTTKM